MESMTGQLLVATPTLKDPNFDRTVVLLVAHETGGALGVVLNRATEVPVADVLGNWGELAGDPAVLFEGGPVQPESAICLARTRPEVKKRRVRLPPGRRRARHGRPVRRPGPAARERGRHPGLRRLLRLVARASSRRRSPPAPGSSSTPCPATRSSTAPTTCGPMVLRRQGDILAAVAHFPPDVSLN